MLKIQGIRARGGAMSFFKGFCTFCKFIPSPTTYQFCSDGISPYPEKSDRKGVRTEKMGGDARARSWESHEQRRNASCTNWKVSMLPGAYYNRDWDQICLYEPIGPVYYYSNSIPQTISLSDSDRIISDQQSLYYWIAAIVNSITIHSVSVYSTRND